MWIAKKKIFPQNTIETIAHPQTKKGKRTPDLSLPVTRNECQSVKWKGWYSVFAGIPNFSLFISTAWLNSPLNNATRDTCDLHNHTSPEQPSRENNLDRKFWKLERVAYLAIETDIDPDNVRWSIENFNNPPGIWPSHVPGEGALKGLQWYGFARFLVRFCGFTKPSGLRYLEMFE